jgi:hypothetical protein
MVKVKAKRRKSKLRKLKKLSPLVLRMLKFPFFKPWLRYLYVKGREFYGGLGPLYKDVHKVFVLGIDRYSQIVWNLDVIGLGFRKVCVFLANLFENAPYSSVLVVNGHYGNVDDSRLGVLLKTVRDLRSIWGGYMLKWIPGSLSNNEWVTRHWDVQLNKLREMRFELKKTFGEVFRQRVLTITRGWRRFRWVPSLVFFLSSRGLYGGANAEASSLLIPNISIVDGGSFINSIAYPWRGNNVDFKSLFVYLRLFKQIIKMGRQNAISAVSGLHRYRRARFKTPVRAEGSARLRRRALRAASRCAVVSSLQRYKAVGWVLFKRLIVKYPFMKVSRRKNKKRCRRPTLVRVYKNARRFRRKLRVYRRLVRGMSKRLRFKRLKASERDKIRRRLAGIRLRTRRVLSRPVVKTWKAKRLERDKVKKYSFFGKALKFLVWGRRQPKSKKNRLFRARILLSECRRRVLTNRILIKI